MDYKFPAAASPSKQQQDPAAKRRAPGAARFDGEDEAGYSSVSELGVELWSVFEGNGLSTEAGTA